MAVDISGRRLGLLSAIVSISIGVGINAVVLGSVANAFLGAMPFAQHKRLATVVTSGAQTPERRDLKASEVRALRLIGSPILEVGTVERWPQSGRGWADVYDGSRTTHPLVAYITSNVLEMAGVQEPGSVQGAPSEAPPAFVTYSYAKALGLTAGTPKAVRVDDRWVSIVGILPEWFRSPLPTMSADHFYGTQDISIWILDQPEDVENYYYTPLLSLADDADLPSLSTEVDRRMQLVLAPQRSPVRYRLEVLRTAIIGKSLSVFLVLVMMSAAVAAMAAINLLTVGLIRTDERHKSIAIHAMLGASPGRLWWLHTRDAAAIIAIAGIAGISVAVLLAPLLSHLMPVIPWTPDRSWYVWLGLGATVAIGILAMLPISLVFVRRWRTTQCLGSGDARANAPSVRSVSALTRFTLTAQIIVICIIGAPTVALNYALSSIPDHRPFLSQQPTLIAQFMTSDRLAASLGGAIPIYDRLRREIQGIPGVTLIGFSSEAPLLNSGEENWLVGAKGHHRTQALGFATDADFLHGLGASLISGRLFDQRDTSLSPPVAILSETLALKIFGTVGVLGQTVDWHGQREILAVVRDIRVSRANETTAVLYVPLPQQPAKRLAAMIQFSRTSEMNDARAVLQNLDHEQPFDRIVSIDELAAVAFSDQKLYARLANLLAGSGIAVAITGLNLAVGYLLRCRRKEIAIRQAVGVGAAQLALVHARFYGSRLLWALLAAIPGSFAAVALLAKAMTPLAIQQIQPAVLTCAVTISVFVVAAVVHSAVFARKMQRTGLRETLASE